MSEIKDRQDAASDIDPIVAALADDTLAVAAVEGTDKAAYPVIDEAALLEVEDLPTPAAEAADRSAGAAESTAEPLAGSLEEFAGSEPFPLPSEGTLYPAIEAGELGPEADFDDAAPAAAVVSPDIAAAIEAALVDNVPQPLAASAFEHLPAAYADTIVELEPEADPSDDDAPLLDVDLEDGIASVFAALHAAREDNAPVEPRDDLEAVDGVTFRLLGELDRLWHRAA